MGAPSFDDFFYDVYNTFNDCGATIDELIDPEFAIELYAIALGIDKTLQGSKEEVKIIAEFHINELRYIVERDAEIVPGLFGDNQDTVDKYWRAFGSQSVCQFFYNVGYIPFDFNEELRWELQEAIGRLRSIKAVNLYIRNDNNSVDARRMQVAAPPIKLRPIGIVREVIRRLYRRASIRVRRWWNNSWAQQ